MSADGGKTANLVIIAILLLFGVSALRDVSSPSATVAILAGLLLAPFILGPILIHRTHWISLDPSLMPFDPEGPASPEELRSHVAETSEDLGRHGFFPEGNFLTKQAVSNAEGSVLLFLNRETRETARVVTAVGTNAKSRMATSMVVLSTEFRDGTRVITSNQTSPTLFPPRQPPYFGRAFPQVREIGLLLEVHRARVENHAAGLLAIDPVGDDPEGYILRVDFHSGLEHYVACGYAFNDELGRIQRMTWKGAFLGTGKILPPVKQIRLAWRRLTAARQLANFKAGRPVD